MRAVNLLPSDLRGAAPKAAPSVRQDKAEGMGAFLVLGALALCVAAFAAYILTTNAVKQREADLQTAKDRGAAATARANALKPYADFQTLASARLETVRGLAAARFDWEQALRDLSRALPNDVRLATLNGDMGLPGAEGAGGDPLRGSIQAPAITLTGCASSQVGVARMLARLKAVEGVTRVSLSKSEKATANTGSSTTTAVCDGDDPPSFSVVIFFERSAAMAALSQNNEASAAAVPVPNAVNKSQPAGGTASGATDPTAAGAPAPADGGAPAEGDSAGTTTSNTTGGTP
jgi:Tfp pilus assembly protein PilN